jgi:murein DD-endopeptidase MepM/ murein hydrolase activator NlpD
MSQRPFWGLTAAAMMLTLIPASPVSADDLRDDLSRLAEHIRTLAGQIDDATAERSQLAAEIRSASASLDRLLVDVSTNESAVAVLEAGIKDQGGRIDTVRHRLSDSYASLYETHSTLVGRRRSAIELARNAYQAGRLGTAAVALTAHRMSDVSIALVYLERVASTNANALTVLIELENRAIDEQSAVLVEQRILAAEASQMETLRSNLRYVLDELNRDRGFLEGTISSLEALLVALDEELAEFSGELEGLELEQGRIKRKITEAQSKRAAPKVSATGVVRPVPGAITSRYGPRVHPVFGDIRVHTGVDLAAGYGERVRGAKAGTVILARNWGGYGRTVVIDHGGGLSTLYAHLSSLSVKDGDTVAAGTVVGKVGTSGLSTGAHLHFEVRRHGDDVDPGPYLRG